MTIATGDDFSQMAQALEKSGGYRVLRRLVPRDVITPVPAGEHTKIGVLLDVETTGLDARKRTRRTGRDLVQFRKMLKAERKKGVPVAELARKHGISPAYIYLLP